MLFVVFAIIVTIVIASISVIPPISSSYYLLSLSHLPSLHFFAYRFREIKSFLISEFETDHYLYHDGTVIIPAIIPPL